MSFVQLSEILGNWGEFIGSMAVLATLVYLAVQVKQSKALLEKSEKIALSQVHQARSDARVASHLHQAKCFSPAVAAAFRRSSELEALSAEERVMLRYTMMAVMVMQDNVMYQHSLGLLDPETLPQLDAVIVRSFDTWEQLEIPITPRLRARHDRIS